MKMLAASGNLLLICAAPCTSMSSSRSLPSVLRLAQKAARRAVVVPEDFGVLQELVLARSWARIPRARRRSIRAILFAAARGACGVGDGKIQIRHHRLRSSLTSVDFPEPEGAEMM